MPIIKKTKIIRHKVNFDFLKSSHSKHVKILIHIIKLEISNELFLKHFIMIKMTKKELLIFMLVLVTILIISKDYVIALILIYFCNLT